jgi:hypothetical protein
MMDSPKVNTADDGMSKVTAAIASPFQKVFKQLGDRYDAKRTGPGGKLSMRQQQAYFDNLAKLNQQTHENQMAKMEKKADIKSRKLADVKKFAGDAAPGSKMTLQVGKVALSQTNAKAPAASKPSKPASAGRSKPSRGGKK